MNIQYVFNSMVCLEASLKPSGQCASSLLARTSATEHIQHHALLDSVGILHFIPSLPSLRPHVRPSLRPVRVVEC